MKTNDGKVPRRLRIYSSGFTARCSGFASVSNFTWFMPRVSMEYPSIASPQQCCWHSELLPLPWLFPLNSLLATWLFSELSRIRAVFHGFIPCACLEAVVFKVSTQGGKTGRNGECRSDVFPWKGDGVFPFLQGETWSWLGAFQELLRSSSQTVNWALGSALTGCFIFVKIALNWTFFLSSPLLCGREEPTTAFWSVVFPYPGAQQGLALGENQGYIFCWCFLQLESWSCPLTFTADHSPIPFPSPSQYKWIICQYLTLRTIFKVNHQMVWLGRNLKDHLLPPSAFCSW